MSLPKIVAQDAAATAGFLSDMFDNMNDPADRLVGESLLRLVHPDE